MLITLIRHIDANRHIVSNYQVGVRLLRGLQYSLMFPTFSHVGVAATAATAIGLLSLLIDSVVMDCEIVGVSRYAK